MKSEVVSKTVLEENYGSTSASINIDDVGNGQKTNFLDNVCTIFYKIT